MSWHHRISISRFRSPKPQNQLPNALTTNLALEPLEPRVLLAGLPTLIDIVAAAGASSPGNFTNVNNTVFFLANNPANGSELWKSDGTGAGTVLVKDIRPGFVGSTPTVLTNVNGTLFFSANDGTSGYELWKSPSAPVCVG